MRLAHMFDRLRRYTENIVQYNNDRTAGRRRHHSHTHKRTVAHIANARFGEIFDLTANLSCLLFDAKLQIKKKKRGRLPNVQRTWCPWTGIFLIVIEINYATDAEHLMCLSSHIWPVRMFTFFCRYGTALHCFHIYFERKYIENTEIQFLLLQYNKEMRPKVSTNIKNDKRTAIQWPFSRNIILDY